MSEFSHATNLQSQQGFTLLEVAVAMAILAVAIGQLFVLFPMGVKLQQMAGEQTHLANLGMHIVSQIRGGVRSDLDGTGIFSPNFVDMKPESAPSSDPWLDEIYNGVDDDQDANRDARAGGRGIDAANGRDDPWPSSPSTFGRDVGWIGSPSPIEMLQVMDDYNRAVTNDDDGSTDPVAQFGDVVNALGEGVVLPKIMKYRWTATTVGESVLYSDNPGSGFYDIEEFQVASTERKSMNAQNQRLSFDIFKVHLPPGETVRENDPEKSMLKKVSVKVYWDAAQQPNRSEEFVTYVSNY